MSKRRRAGRCRPVVHRLRGRVRRGRLAGPARPPHHDLFRPVPALPAGRGDLGRQARRVAGDRVLARIGQFAPNVPAAVIAGRREPRSTWKRQYGLTEGKHFDAHRAAPASTCGRCPAGRGRGGAGRTGARGAGAHPGGGSPCAGLQRGPAGARRPAAGAAAAAGAARAFGTTRRGARQRARHGDREGGRPVSADVVIVGAGVIGAATAFHPQPAGRRRCPRARPRDRRVAGQAAARPRWCGCTTRSAPRLSWPCAATRCSRPGRISPAAPPRPPDRVDRVRRRGGGAARQRGDAARARRGPR